MSNHQASSFTSFSLKKGAQQGSGTQMASLRLWPTCFWLGFPGTFPLHGPCAPCVPSTAALLRLQCPGWFAQQHSHFLGTQPGREVLEANGRDETSRQLGGSSPPCSSWLYSGVPQPQPPAAFLGGPPQGLAAADGEGCVDPISSLCYVYLSKFNSPAGFIHPKPTCSLVAELWVWLLLQRFLAASDWWFAACSLSPAEAGSSEVLGKPVLPACRFYF